MTEHDGTSILGAASATGSFHERLDALAIAMKEQMITPIGYATYKDFIQTLLAALKADFGDGVIVSCALFGSVARGEAGIYNDLDLLIIHKPVLFSPEERFVETLLRVRKGEEYGELTDKGLYPQPAVIFKTREELCRQPLILLDVMDHGMILFDEGGVLTGILTKFRAILQEMGAEKIVFEDGSWAWDIKPDWKPGEVIEIVL